MSSDLVETDLDLDPALVCQAPPSTTDAIEAAIDEELSVAPDLVDDASSVGDGGSLGGDASSVDGASSFVSSLTEGTAKPNQAWAPPSQPTIPEDDDDWLHPIWDWDEYWPDLASRALHLLRHSTWRDYLRVTRRACVATAMFVGGCILFVYLKLRPSDRRLKQWRRNSEVVLTHLREPRVSVRGGGEGGGGGALGRLPD